MVPQWVDTLCSAICRFAVTDSAHHFGDVDRWPCGVVVWVIFFVFLADVDADAVGAAFFLDKVLTMINLCGFVFCNYELNYLCGVQHNDKIDFLPCTVHSTSHMWMSSTYFLFT